jgi:hypothetical protein
VATGPQRLNTKWGGQGAFEFDTSRLRPRREYMQVHAGRWGPGAHHHGAFHEYSKSLAARGQTVPTMIPLSVAQTLLSDCVTEGCIRTTEEAMRVIRLRHVHDPIRGLWVMDSMHWRVDSDTSLRQGG